MQMCVVSSVAVAGARHRTSCARTVQRQPQHRIGDVTTICDDVTTTCFDVLGRAAAARETPHPHAVGRRTRCREDHGGLGRDATAACRG